MNFGQIMSDAREGIAIYDGGADQTWLVFDARPANRRIWSYRPQEVEHVTCTSDAECTTPDC